MTSLRAVLLVLLITAPAGALLHAQQEGSVEISYTVEDDQLTTWDAWRESEDGPFVLALPYAIQMRYNEPESRGTGQRKLLILADRALLWFSPHRSRPVRRTGTRHQEPSILRRRPHLAEVLGR